MKTLGLRGAVGMVTDGDRPRHTHWPEALRRMLTEERPDLVIADHGLAGAAIDIPQLLLVSADRRGEDSERHERRRPQRSSEARAPIQGSPRRIVYSLRVQPLADERERHMP